MVIYRFGANPLIHQQRLWLCNLELTLHGPSQKNTLLRVEWSPLWHLFAIVSDISSGNILNIYIYILYIYMRVVSSSDILFWQSIRHSIWHSILAFYLASILTSYLAFFVASILTIFSGILSGIFSAICSDTFWHAIWHSIWHSILILSGIYFDIIFWHSIWYIFGDSLWLRSGGDSLWWRGSLWSRGCCSGPARNTAIYSLQLRSGGERGRKEEGGRRKEEGGLADIKSNNPHLVEKTYNSGVTCTKWVGAMHVRGL